VILTSEGTASSSEIFSAAFQDTGRAKMSACKTSVRVIGIATIKMKAAASWSQRSSFLHFPKDASSKARASRPNKVVPTIADLQQKRDVALVQAEQLLASMSTAKPVVRVGQQ